MPYCLACGKLRETDGGMCRQCREDERIRKQSAAKDDRIRILIENKKQRS